MKQLSMFDTGRRRPPTLRVRLDRELVVDSFAGGGGASTGMELALGRSPDLAINHDPEALAMHEANHPDTKHFCENVWKVHPEEATGGRPVGLAWFSPDCCHFSRAKGQTPVKKEIRGLAWVVIRWARIAKPRVIVVENVEEFQSWGPLAGDRPDPARAGLTFRRWVGNLRGAGYHVEWRSLVAADYGTPTTRKRLYLIARRDGAPIVWPDVTHQRARWRPASEVIDWTLPCPSIFERPRPLADKTLARIAEGVRRYVLDTDSPFIAPSHVAPTLIQTGYGERPGQTPRVPGLDKPLGTLVAGGVKHALVAGFLAQHFGGMVGRDLHRTLGTVTAKDHHSLVTSHLAKFYGTSTGADMRAPLGTVTGGGQHFAEVRAFLSTYYGTDRGRGRGLGAPLRTVTTKDRHALVAVAGGQYALADIGMRMLSPRELYNAQGFPSDYVIERGADGQPITQTAQVRMAGNSVCPPVAAALIEANVTEHRQAARRIA